jgi:hypothetical protein
MVEYIPCYGGPAEHWGPLPATRLASRKILIEQNIKKRTGPSLCVLCGEDYVCLSRQHTAYSSVVYFVYYHYCVHQVGVAYSGAVKISNILNKSLASCMGAVSPGA